MFDNVGRYFFHHALSLLTSGCCTRHASLNRFKKWTTTARARAFARTLSTIRFTNRFVAVVVMILNRLC